MALGTPRLCKIFSMCKGLRFFMLGVGECSILYYTYLIYLIYDPLFTSIVVPLIYSGDSVANQSIALPTSFALANLPVTTVFKNASLLANGIVSSPRKHHSHFFLVCHIRLTYLFYQIFLFKIKPYEDVHAHECRE